MSSNETIVVYSSTEPGDLYSNVARFEHVYAQETRDFQDLKIIFTRDP